MSKFITNRPERQTRKGGQFSPLTASDFTVAEEAMPRHGTDVFDCNSGIALWMTNAGMQITSRMVELALGERDLLRDFITHSHLSFSSERVREGGGTGKGEI